MPRVSRVFVRTALACLVAALGVGVAAAWPGSPAAALPGLEPVRVHLLAVGWLTGLVVGVAHWLFPRRRDGAAPWVVYGLLYGGLLLRVVGEPAWRLGGGAGWARVLAASAVLQAAALVTFAVLLWPRAGAPRAAAGG